MFSGQDTLMQTLRDVQAAFSNSRYARELGQAVTPNTLHRVEAATINQYLPAGGSLLDIGTGTGVMPHLFHKLGARAISVDFPATGGTGALARLIEIGIEGFYLQVGVDPLPIDDESIDVVFVGNVIEHLPHSPRRFLADVKRVLKPQGHLVIDTINAVDLRRRIKFALGIPNWPPIEALFPLEFHHEHHKEYTLAELRTALTLAGFQIVQGFSFEVFFTQPLRRSPWQFIGKSARLMSQTEHRSIFAERFQPLNPAEYARLALLLMTRALPGLRSDIMVVGRK